MASKAQASVEFPPLGLSLTAVFLGAILGVAAIAASGAWTDRSNWTSLACVRSHEETYRYRDDRPHGQGGRGGMLTGRREVCDERATIGPVMPSGWRP